MRIIATAPIAAPSSSVSANTTNAQLFADYRNSLLACALLAPGSSILEGKKFTVRASGNVTTAGTYNVTATLYGKVLVPTANPLTAGSWTVIKASTARSVDTITAAWYLEAHLCVDKLGGLLQGTCEHMINNLFDAQAAVTALTTIDPSAQYTCAFAVGITFATGSATNVGRLMEFSLGW